MLVNLCGPPCSGKTSLASRFITEHPKYEHLSIDAFRIKFQEEDMAWFELMCAASAAEHSILETSGLSWHIEPHFLQHRPILRRGVLTIVLCGSSEDFQERLRARKAAATKPDIPFTYKGLTQEGLIRVCDEKLGDKYPSAYFLCTDSTGTEEDQYREFREVVLDREKKIKKFLQKG